MKVVLSTPSLFLVCGCLWWAGMGDYALSLLPLVTGIAAIRALVFVLTLPKKWAAYRATSFRWAVLGFVGNGAVAAWVVWAALVMMSGMAHGRRLRSRGKSLVPSTESQGTWTTLAIEPGASPFPHGLADRWRENGAVEHASIAAFARLTLDLMGVGAPPSLIAAANLAALGEVRHAEFCFSVARAIDGSALSPAPFPEAAQTDTPPRDRRLALRKLAVESLVDGALGERVSANVLAQLAGRCRVPAIGDTLRGMATDEAGHAELGWAVVEWCVQDGGEVVVDSLRDAVRLLPARVETGLPQAARDGSWERYGIHGAELEAREYAAVVEALNARLRDLAAKTTQRAA
ncbi:MAG: hypothetical protein ABI672_20045 [Vicinamibacteria bacterium]